MRFHTRRTSTKVDTVERHQRNHPVNVIGVGSLRRQQCAAHTHTHTQTHRHHTCGATVRVSTPQNRRTVVAQACGWVGWARRGHSQGCNIDIGPDGARIDVSFDTEAQRGQAGPNLACRLTRREEKSAAACFLLCCTHAVGTDGPRGAWSTRRSSRVCVYMKRVVGGSIVCLSRRERGLARRGGRWQTKEGGTPAQVT